MSVLIETTLGDLVIDLFTNERPTTCKNFLKLCRIKYYNLNQIFKIERDYIAQSGDPTNTGRGGGSVYSIVYGDQARYFELESIPKINHVCKGLISMVNNGSGMAGSQFFITLGNELDYLDGKHCVFGQVAEGLDTVDKINEQLVDDNNRPYKDIRISHTIILHDPFDDLPRLPISRRSPSPTRDLLKLDDKIALDESICDEEGKTAEEIKEEMEAKDMNAQAQILEMIGDVHYAEEKPPDNVLFVCKLNPVTTSEDLEIIFSRFGSIKCCEVIKDRRTEASLQYAFIEFDKPEYCEAAFLKMDNTLIDDRRIHVDFSQSVAKNYQWKRQLNEEEIITKRDPEERTRRHERTAGKSPPTVDAEHQRRKEKRSNHNIQDDHHRSGDKRYHHRSSAHHHRTNSPSSSPRSKKHRKSDRRHYK